MLPREIGHGGERVSRTPARGRPERHALRDRAQPALQGLPSTVTMRGVEAINTAWCRPPLEHREVERLVHKAYIAADAPGFAARYTAGDVIHDAPEVDR